MQKSFFNADILFFTKANAAPARNFNSLCKKIHMELRRNDFPITLQAYDVRDAREQFVAEQVVTSQTEADNFMALYAGKLIKTRPVERTEIRKQVHSRRGAAVPVWVWILAVLIILGVVAYATGWLQTWIAELS